ncbi:DUF4349 domain-containing protein [Streptomyces sp. NBC_01268]|uniref:DUF4349 domain-containing protein n=1 Tax=Streptomyces sp. NBC_01268 TaxID=2903806 RepID=UPI002E331576|nr:DUF4349 domain-containing protein [Streptomyces sp. NBC_01268]
MRETARGTRRGSDPGRRRGTRRGTARAAAGALLAGTLFLTGCAGSGGADTASADAKDPSQEKPAYDASGAAGAAGADKAADGREGTRAPVQEPQHVIRTAELSVEVKDAGKALASARRVTAGAGGHVENETTERVDDTHVTSRVVLRVPQERYDSVLAELAGAGRLLSRRADAKDVTGQVVDVESRIATQRASVARVRALMDKATRLGDVVTLEGELSRRQADLESLLAQQAALKDRTTLATITLELTEPESGAPAGDEDRPGFLDALGGGWDALVAALAWTLVVLAAIAPWLALLALAYAVWRWVLRPRLPRRAKPEPVPGPASGAWPAPPRRPVADADRTPEAVGEQGDTP